MVDQKQVLDLALLALQETQSMRPCEVMAGETLSWCERNCRPEYPAAMAECWRHYLETEYARKWAEAINDAI